MRVPLSLHPSQHLLLPVNNSSHPSGCEVSNFGFDLHSADDCMMLNIFYVLIGHLYIIFGEMSIQILCPF